ncbi:MAG: hypothetical protein IJS08_06605 [Victivallales bacterium]|nr:hypothetical protein [Victivallales bacterium]
MMKHICFSLFVAFAMVSLFAEGLGISTTGAKAFVRNDKGVLHVVLRNDGTKALTGIKLDGNWIGGHVTGALDKLEAGASKELVLPVETRLAVGKYDLELQGTAKAADGASVTGNCKVQITIAKMLQDRIPIVMNDSGGWKDAHNLGFTHSIDYICYFLARRPNFKLSYEHLDNVLVTGHRFQEQICAPPELMKKYPRLDKNGNPYNSTRNMDVSNPEFLKEWQAFFTKAMGFANTHPAFETYCTMSESHDNTQPSFTKYTKEAFKKYAGYDIPVEIDSREAPHYSSIKNFPISRVIDEEDRIFKFYTWFWKEGDGWNNLYSFIHDMVKENVKHKNWTFFDPSVRVPPVWGSGGKVDYISHWTYAYPDPIRVGVATSEQQAMAAGRPGQKIMNMTQNIAYRSQVAPKGAKVSKQPSWVNDEPNAVFITLAPDLMREAAWTQISRHVQGIMFHGHPALFKVPNSKHGYRFTNGETAGVLKDFFARVVKPLGPVLKSVPERNPEVMVLESFASSVFAGRGTWGERGWEYDASLMMLWANMAPRVIYEEKIARDGLDGVKVLVMPYCDVLPKTVYNKILDFQKKGGLVVADEYAVPGIVPDISIKAYRRTGDPRKDKETLQNAGLELRRALAPYYSPYASTSNPDLVTWVRSSDKADYLFVVNDKRTFGDYWGQYGLVMEKGVSNSGTVTLKRNAGAVYDLVEHKEVKFSSDGNNTTMDFAFNAPDNGRLYLVLPEKLVAPSVKLASKAKRGENVALAIEPRFASGKAVKSIHPLQIEVKDANGNVTDDSKFAASIDGSCKHNISLPLNAAVGSWNITVTDLATGNAVAKTLQVK